VQHAVLAKICKLVWVDDERPLLEVSTAEIDNRGYDVVLSLGAVVRHVQLKSTQEGGKRSKVDVHVGLTDKPSGCIVWYEYDPATLEIRRYHFFGSTPGESLPDLAAFKVAKKSRGNSAGVKTARRSVRLVHKSKFESDLTAEELLIRLFGEA
jgi:hypothetical protein